MRVKELNEAEIKKAVFTFGRLNPPHFGHHALIQTLQKTAQKQGCDWFLFVSSKTGDEKNPLTYEQKVWWIQALYPETKGHLIVDPSIKTPLIAATWLYNQGYRAATFVAGEDDMSSYGEMIKSGNAHGQANPNSVKSGKGFIFNPLDFAISPRLASATNARRNVTDGDPEAFVRSILGPKISPQLAELVHDQLYPTLRKAMGLSESVRESAELNKSTPSVQDLARKYATEPAEIHRQINRGVKIEFEHTNDIEVATEIAMDHLKERLDYYDLLDKLEKTPKKKFGENFADGKGPGRPGDSQRHGIPKTVDEAMWPFKKKKAPEMSAPKRWPDRDDDLEQWMRDKITHYKSKGWDPAVFFSPATGDYFPIYFATSFSYNDAAKQAYRNIKREFPYLVKRAREEISTPMAMRINQSRVGDHEDWPENSPGVYENFADGKGPGRPGDSQRHGIPKGASISQLEKASHADGRKGQLARWQLNMRRGKKRANEEITNEVADQPYRFISPVSTATTQKSMFNTDGGATIQVFIQVDTESGVADIGFYDATDKENPTIGMTGKGDAFRIFATVGVIVKQFVNKRKPQYISFSGKASEAGRIKLYDMIAKNIGRYLPEYKLVNSGDIMAYGDKGYMFKRVAQEGVEEGIGTKLKDLYHHLRYTASGDEEHKYKKSKYKSKGKPKTDNDPYKGMSDFERGHTIRARSSDADHAREFIARRDNPRVDWPEESVVEEKKPKKPKTIIDGALKTLIAKGRSEDEAIADLKKEIDGKFYDLGESQLMELRGALLQYIKQALPTWPEYVVRDWIYNNNKVDFGNGADIKSHLSELLKSVGLTPNSKWTLVPNLKFTMDMFEPWTQGELKNRAGGAVKNVVARDAERHATQAALAQQQGGVRKEPVILIKHPEGYELQEGWHRTIQHFAQFPNGYTGPAWIAESQTSESWSPMELAIMEGGHLLEEFDESLDETLKKVKGEWALVSRKNPKKVLQYYKGSGHPSKEWVNKVERRVHSFESTEAKIDDDWFKTGSFKTYKKATPIKYQTADKAGVLQTLEGPVKYDVGFKIITGPKGEQYPIPPEKFESLYDDNGDGTATPKKIIKLAKLADHDGVVNTSWGEPLHYTAGNDYIVRHGSNDYGAIKKDIFAQTYVKESVNEANYDMYAGVSFPDGPVYYTSHMGERIAKKDRLAPLSLIQDLLLKAKREHSAKIVSYDYDNAFVIKKKSGPGIAVLKQQQPDKSIVYKVTTYHPDKNIGLIQDRVFVSEMYVSEDEDDAKPLVYLDMDGVLADFFGEWSRLAGVDHYKDIDDAEAKLQLVRDHPTFWVDLPLLPHAKALVKTVIEKYGEYRICSTPLEGDERSKPGKIAWIKKHFADMPPVEIVLTQNKAEHATHNGVASILVDDFGTNINKWKAAGGIGIKYEDSAFPKVATVLTSIAKSGVPK